MTKTGHSPLGASSAERWVECSGSVALIDALELPKGEGSDFSREGTAAHELASHCLITDTDAWEHIHNEFNGYKATAEMANAVQLYLDTVRELSTPGALVLVEEHISSDIHDLFYGTVDHAVVADDVLQVTDYKHGVGVSVDAIENKQLMYYALGIIKKYETAERVVLRIVQPRDFHPDGHVREWETTRTAILLWADEVLLPAMNLAADGGDGLLTGKWCRFCPAKITCPVMRGMFAAATKADPASAKLMTDTELANERTMVDQVKMYLKAIEDETMRRLVEGRTIGGWKVVNKKADRVFPEFIPTDEEAENGEKITLDTKVFFRDKLGEDAFTPPSLKSPAAMAKIGPAAKKLVELYAYSPFAGLTVAPGSDKRSAVKTQSAAEKFGHFIEGTTDD